MKVAVCLVFILKTIYCEIPPPYPPREFRSSFRLLSSFPQTRYGVPNQPVNRPHTVYGPPKNAEPLDPSFQQPPNPAKFSNLRLFQNGKYQTIQGAQHIPQSLYGSPNNFVSASNLKAQRQEGFTPQTIYGLPKTSGSIPQTSYGVPAKQIIPNKQNNFALSLQNSLPQVNYGVPSRHPESEKNYAAPGLDSSTLEEIKWLRQLIQKIDAQRIAQLINAQSFKQQYPSQEIAFSNQNQGNRHAQSLPNREATNFRFSNSEQYLPVKEPENFKKDISLQFNWQNGARSQNVPVNNYNSPRGGGDQPILPTKYIPAENNDNGYQGNPENSPSQSGNSWNNLDLPTGSSPNVDIQKVEVTQFGPNRNRNRNNSINPPSRPHNDNKEVDVKNKYIPPVADSVTRVPLSTTTSPLDLSSPDNTYQSSEDNFTESPNIAVATAVPRTPDNQFYLLHPDGSYQKIISPKSRLQVENQIYQLYQNLEVDPNIIYSPLYSLLTK